MNLIKPFRRAGLACAYLALSCVAFALLASVTSTPLWAQDTSLLTYEGPERADKLLTAAKKEGKLTLYTAFRPQDLQALVEPFEKKTGIKLTVWRSGATNVLQRVLKESAGDRHEADFVLMPSTEMEALRRERQLAAVKSPYFKDLLPSALPTHREWAPVLLNVLVPTYNSTVVKKEDLPKTYQDLLDPKWKGKLGIESKLDEWYLTLITSMGEAQGSKFFSELSAKNGLQSRLGMSLLNNLVISGEVPLALAVYRDLPEKAKRKGASIDSFTLDPIIAQAFVGAVLKKAPRPNAALLFQDYLLSEETQKLLASLDFHAASTKLQPAQTGTRMLLVDPVFAVDNAERATKAFEDMLAGRGK
jgi:iron(III) transport system substrate-binding protein